MSDTDVDKGHTSQIIENSSIMKSSNEFAMNILLRRRRSNHVQCALFFIIERKSRHLANPLSGYVVCECHLCIGLQFVQ